MTLKELQQWDDQHPNEIIQLKLKDGRYLNGVLKNSYPGDTYSAIEIKQEDYFFFEIGQESKIFKVNQIEKIEAVTPSLSRLEYLLSEERKFQDKLKEEDYTLIAPTDPQQFGKFIQKVHDLAPTAFYSSLHDSLKHKDSVKKALITVSGVPLQIYVITPTNNDAYLTYVTIDNY